MKSDKKLVITREGELAKITVLDLNENGTISSFSTRAFANDEKATDEALVAYARQLLVPEEADELELVSLESFSPDEMYSTLVSDIEEVSVITDFIGDNPQTSVNEALDENLG